MNEQAPMVIPCNGEPHLKHYFEVDAEAQKSDYTFFIDNPGRAYLIREPYSNEVTEGLGEDVHFVVVRQHGPDTFERRAFQIREAGDLKLREVMETAHDEILGRVLWAVWDIYDGGLEVSSDVVNMAIRALYVVMKLDPKI